MSRRLYRAESLLQREFDPNIRFVRCSNSPYPSERS